MIRPTPRPVDAYMRGLPRTTLGLSLAFLLGAALFGALTWKELGTWRRYQQLASAPVVAGEVLAVDVSKAGRWSQYVSVDWVSKQVPGGGMRQLETTRVGPFGDLAPMKALKPGGPIALHASTSPAGPIAVSAPTLAAHRPLEIPVILGILLLTAGLILPVTLDARRAATRIRDWPVVLAQVQRSGGSDGRPELTLRYSHAGQAHSVTTTMSLTDLQAWAKQVGTSTEGPLPLMLDPADPSRWQPCRFEWEWVKA